MKQLVEVIEVSGEGFDALLGKHILVFCVNYIYAGELVGVNESFIKIRGAKIVYETGPFSDKNYKDAQSLPCEDWYIQRASVESFGGQR